MEKKEEERKKGTIRTNTPPDQIPPHENKKAKKINTKIKKKRKGKGIKTNNADARRITKRIKTPLKERKKTEILYGIYNQYRTTKSNQ